MIYAVFLVGNISDLTIRHRWLLSDYSTCSPFSAHPPPGSLKKILKIVTEEEELPNKASKSTLQSSLEIVAESDRALIIFCETALLVFLEG